MYRALALLALLLGSWFVYVFTFTTFDRNAGWEVADEGHFTRRVIECPPPWSVVFDDSGLEPETVGECLLPARTLIIESALVGGLALAVAIWGLIRGARPGPERIEPLSRRLDL